MPILGTGALALALGACLLTILTGFYAGRTGLSRHVELSRMGLYLQFGLVGFAAAVLVYSFVAHDFSLAYVYGRSDVRMPLFYLVAALWGGQEGSLVLWLLVGIGLSSAAAWVNRDRVPELMPWFHAVSSLGHLGFLCVLVFVTPPFDTFVVMDTPHDGEGLNPLLQTPLMVIHPPTLLAGFASAIVPFSFAMAALWARQPGSEWLRVTRSWTLLCWLLLSCGNILGGMWAYRELGWGGYWAWDPVENAALVPWFTASALLHSAIIQEQRGMLKRWNAVLVSLTFLLTLLGTWMTRSGLIESVHTFAESQIGTYFLIILLSMTAFAVVSLAANWSSLRSEARLDSTVSREGAFVLNNWAFLALAFVVLWGTLFPKFKEMVTGDAISIGPAWFNRMTPPLAIALLALMALGTLLPFRRTTLRALFRNFTAPVAITAVVTPLLAWGWWAWRGEPLGVQAFSNAVALGIVLTALVVFNTVVIAIEYAVGVRARLRTGDRDVLGALLSLLRRHRRRYGGYIVHVGVLMILFAFVGNAVKADVDATLAVGDRVALGDYVVSFDALETVERTDRRETVATMGLTRGGADAGTLHPARYDYNDYAALGGGAPSPMKVTSEIFIRSTPLEDVYVALLNVDAERNAAAFKLVVLPFTWWFWAGGLVLVLGTLVCVWPTDEVFRGSTRSRAAAVGQIIVAALAFAATAAVVLHASDVRAQEAAHRDEPVRTADLSPEQRAIFDDVSALVMTTCEGCAGKTLSTASPSCVPSNHDRQRIRELILAGQTRDQILATFVQERGEIALAIPPERGLNRLSWLVPLLGSLLAALGVVLLFRAWRRGDDAGATEAPLSAEDRALLQRFRDEAAGAR
jgi:cytochrome c-type biogenesis protein CcmF